MEQKLNPCCSQELMEGDQITKPEWIEVPAGFARDEIGHEIPKDAPLQHTARAAPSAQRRCLHTVAPPHRCLHCRSLEKKLVCSRSTF